MQQVSAARGDGVRARYQASPLRIVGDALRLATVALVATCVLVRRGDP